MKKLLKILFFVYVVSTSAYATQIDDDLRQAVRDEKVWSSIRLLIKGVNSSNPDNEGITALQLATAKKFHPVLDLMLVLNKKLDDADARGWTPLFYSIQNSTKFVMLELLKSGANPNLREKITGFSPLEYAIEISNLAIVKKLLNHGASMIGEDYLGNNALMYSADQKDMAIFEMLFKLKHDELISSLLHQNKNGQIASTFAAQAQNITLALFLNVLGETKFDSQLQHNYEVDVNGFEPIDYFSDTNKTIYNCAADDLGWSLYFHGLDSEDSYEKIKEFINYAIKKCRNKWHLE